MISIWKANLAWVLAWMFCSQTVLAQGPPDRPRDHPESCARIWQGFEQRWSYPHPLIRFQDGIEFSDTPCVFGHPHLDEASKLKDTLQFTQYFSEVEAPEVGFYPLEQSFVLEGRSGDSIGFDTTVSFFHPDLKDSSTAMTILLNGFDIQSKGDPKGALLQALSIGVEIVDVDVAKSVFRYRLQGHVVLKAYGPGAKTFRSNLVFELNVSTLAVIGGDFSQRTETLYQSASWERESEESPGAQVALIPEAPDAMAKVVGITRVSLLLSEGFAIQGWAFFAQQRQKDEFGSRAIDLKLEVDPWAADCKKHFKSKNLPSNRSGYKDLVRRLPGTALSEMEIKVLKFRAGEAIPARSSGQIIHSAAAE